jgi:hypothetical protein
MDKEICDLYLQWSIIQPKENSVMLFAGKWVELEIIRVRERSQAYNHMVSLIHRL